MYKVSACFVWKQDDWYYMTYLGSDSDMRAANGMARSRDGITNWQRHPDNPVFGECEGEWDCAGAVSYTHLPIYEAQMTSPDGNIYGLPHAEFDINNYVLMWNIIRQDWLDKLGLEMPATIDEYHDVLVAFRDQDPNGNGKKDVYKRQASRLAAFARLARSNLPAVAPFSASTLISRFFFVESVTTSPSSSANLEACSASS